MLIIGSKEHCQQVPLLLSPFFKLTMEQQQDVSTWLTNSDPGFISFEAKAAPFPDSYFSAEVINISPHTWWQGAAGCGVDPAFADQAQTLTVTTSLVSIERVLSTFSFVHKIRNRLGVKKANKLVCCYRILCEIKDLDC
ncbi:hypothetical protein LSH36_32g17037 [Paralvinella palmiformis]|uniref:Uncharacterized protein n=1 Tax=Paralvinella palmiformis TaxID=53620 RepID=A0AAD9K9S0_9ANNE|nr:hypothetical protein LSH36_32g17037 [Paralvinella palmiformis]